MVMLISLGKISPQLLCPFLYTFFCFFRSFAYMEDIKNPFIPILLSSIAELSMGLLEFISIKRQDNKIRNKEKDISLLSLIMNFQTKNRRTASAVFL